MVVTNHETRDVDRDERNGTAGHLKASDIVRCWEVRERQHDCRPEGDSPNTGSCALPARGCDGGAVLRWGQQSSGGRA